MTASSITASIAEIVFRIHFERSMKAVEACDLLRPFLCVSKPDINIRFQSDLAHIRLEEEIFDPKGAWMLHRAGTRMVLSAWHEGPETSFTRMIACNPDYREVEAFSNEPNPNLWMGNFLVEWPLAPVLAVCVLSRCLGVLVHACGIDDHGKGCLFVGNSGQGKSTMAGLWQGRADILNDDRIIIRRNNGRFWIYGTPWHGDFTEVSSKSVPLDKIFFLRGKGCNSVSQMSTSQAITSLLTRSFPPLWDKAGTGFTLDFVTALVSKVPCFHLDFAPEQPVMDFIHSVK